MSLKPLIFSAEDLVSMLGKDAALPENAQRIQNARLNQVSGPAITLVDDKKKVVACLGIRTAGIAEAWAMFSDEFLKNKRQVFEESSKWLEQMIRQERVWRVFAEAESEKSVRLLSHVGFRPAKDEPRIVMVR